MVTTPSKPAPAATATNAASKKVPAAKPGTAPAKKAAAEPAKKAQTTPVKKVAAKAADKSTAKSAGKSVAKKTVKPVVAHVDPSTVHLMASTAPKPYLTLDQRHHYVSVAAFYIAERRGFTLGNPAEDWLAAEAEVDRLIASGHFTA
jgi:hypothetical protein